MQNLKAGDIVDYKMGESNWTNVEIIDNLGGMVWIYIVLNGTKSSPWIHYDADRFAVKDSETEEYKYHVDFYQAEKLNIR